MIRVDNYAITADIMEILDRLKFEISNGKLGSYRKSSSGIQVTCPIHSNGHEKKPSCYIRESDGVFHCFSCGEKGPFHQFVASVLDCSIENAKIWLCKNYGTKVSELNYVGEDIRRIEPESKYREYVNPEVLSHFQDWTPYFKTREITRETVKRFGLKYDPENRVVIFPCYDVKGNLVMLHTRSIDKKMFHLDEDVPKPLFGLYNIVSENINKAIITEGPFDALKAYQFGFPACATMGNISDSQIEQINDSGIEYLYIMFDNDRAGRQFAEDLKAKLNKNILIYEPQIPNNKKDIGELNYEEFWSSINNCNNSAISIKKPKLIIV